MVMSPFAQMKAGMSVHFDEAKLKKVARRYNLDLIILFGSHAKGRAR